MLKYFLQSPSASFLDELRSTIIKKGSYTFELRAPSPVFQKGVYKMCISVNYVISLMVIHDMIDYLSLPDTLSTMITCYMQRC